MLEREEAKDTDAKVGVICHAVICITIIDTIILHIHTNDAYYYDTDAKEEVDKEKLRESLSALNAINR
jgi:hypothetical protein